MKNLPIEIKEFALQVPEKKQNEVQKVLNDIFTGTDEWESKVDAIKVKDINDIMSIQLADTARINAKKARLNAEKIFDAKRDELKKLMSDFKLEDNLWLKSKQIMQLKFKHIEEKAKYKSDFIKRFEKEQLELRTGKRLTLIFPYNSETQRSEIELLTNEAFDILIDGLKSAKEQKDKIEKELKLKRIAEEKAEKERIEKIEAENKRLEKEAIEKERIEKIERDKREKAEKERLEKEKIERVKIDNEKIRLAKIEAEKQDVLNAKIEKERLAKEKLQKELQDKKDKEIKEANEKAAKEKSLLLAPDKDKLLKLSVDFLAYPLPELKSNEAKSILNDVKILINKISVHIKTKSKNL